MSISTWFGLFAFRVKDGSFESPWRNSAWLLFHCRSSIWPQKAVELQVEFQTVWYIFDEQVECIWKSLDTNVEKVIESAKDTKKVKDKTTKEIEQNLLQGLFTVTIRTQILRGSLFFSPKIKLFFTREILCNFFVWTLIWAYSFIRHLRYYM